MIESVNRKYNQLFGQEHQLIALKPDLDGLETEDFMKFLQNDQKKKQLNRHNNSHNLLPKGAKNRSSRTNIEVYVN